MNSDGRKALPFQRHPIRVRSAIRRIGGAGIQPVDCGSSESTRIGRGHVGIADVVRAGSLHFAAGLARAGGFAESWPGIFVAWLIVAAIAWRRLPALGVLT